MLHHLLLATFVWLLQHYENNPDRNISLPIWFANDQSALPD